MNMDYQRVGGDEFIPSLDVKPCSLCSRRRLVGKESKVILCSLCDVPWWVLNQDGLEPKVYHLGGGDQ